MKEFLIKLLSIGHSCPERAAIISAEINTAKEEHIELAYRAALDGFSNKRIIYLLGGNDSSKCPFK